MTAETGASQPNVFEISEPAPGCSIGRVIAVMSGKGGVGKSTVTVLAAAALRREGLSVGILDGDITGPSIPKMLGVGPDSSRPSTLPALTASGIAVASMNLLLPEETAPVVWRGPLIGGAIKQFFSDIDWGYLDVLLVDLPPGTGDAPLSTLQSLPVDGVVIVTSPQEMAAMVVEKAVRMVGMLDKPILGIIENMDGFVCPHCGEVAHVFGASRGQALADKYGVPWLGSLPLDPRIAALSGLDLERYESPAADTVAALSAAVKGDLSNE